MLSLSALRSFHLLLSTPEVFLSSTSILGGNIVWLIYAAHKAWFTQMNSRKRWNLISTLLFFIFHWNTQTVHNSLMNSSMTGGDPCGWMLRWGELRRVEARWGELYAWGGIKVPSPNYLLLIFKGYLIFIWLNSWGRRFKQCSMFCFKIKTAKHLEIIWRLFIG